MARLFIYDSNAVQDAAGNVLTMSLVNSTYRASQPVRLYGAVNGPINDIGYEFLFTGDTAVSANVNLFWYQEFLNDAPSRTLPSLRSAPTVSPTAPWCREQLQYSTGALISGSQVASQVEHYDILRHAVIADGTTYFAAGNSATFAHAIYAPSRVHGLFVRLQITVTALPASGSYRLRAWAIVGGQDQQDAQEAQLYPYVAEL